ncbi:MAG: alanine racemase, partial [Lachnospiraceae bacterium]|nr:alanine racemase [Lachnospiraceae bacterium]
MSSGQNESIEKERAWIRIQLKNLGHNMSVLESLLPKKCKIMAIVKANAYGHGANEVSLYLNSLGYQSFAVATAQEGIALRQAGVVGEILVLGYTDPNTVRDLLAFSLTQTATDKTHAYALAREADLCKAILPIQIKVDTGMNRLGESWAHSEQIAEYFTLRSLDIRGIFSHLCVADSEKETDIRYTKDQIEKF